MSEQLKEQVYRAAAQAANDALAAVVQYEGGAASLWRDTPIGEQNTLQLEARQLHTGKMDDELASKPRAEDKEHKELREKILKLVLTHLTAPKSEPKAGLGSSPPKAETGPAINKPAPPESDNVGKPPETVTGTKLPVK